MAISLPYFDFKIDIDGQLVTTASGFVPITDEDLLRQHARVLLMTNFKGTDYMALPNTESTAAILKDDITEILTKDPLFFSLKLQVIVDAYPKDLNSIGFSVMLIGKDFQIDLGTQSFLTLRAGLLLGPGEFTLDASVYNRNITKRVFERLTVTGKITDIQLTKPLVQGTQLYILPKRTVTGFVGGLPVPVLVSETGTFQIYSNTNLIALSDFLPSADLLKVYNIVLKQDNGDVIPSTTYNVVGSYLVFNEITYTGQITAEADLVEVAGDMSKYTETNGIHPVDIYGSARENKEYKVTISGNLQPGDYFIVYDSYEVLS